MTPALFNKLVKLGFEPGSRNPEEWAVHTLELVINKLKYQAENFRPSEARGAKEILALLNTPTDWYDCAHCDAGYPDQECTCKTT